MTCQRAPRVLVVRPDHLGDVLLTLPAISLLRVACPDARITTITPAPATAATRLCPDIDVALSVPFPPIDRPIEQTPWADDALREGMRFRDAFDVAILPRPDDPWSGRLVTSAGIPVRVGYDRPRTRPFLTHALPLPSDRHVVVIAAHITRLAATLAGGSPPRDVPSPVATPLVTTREHEAEVDRVLGQSASPPLIVLHPGSGWPLKNWRPEAWGMVARSLHERYGVTPLITGDARERRLVEAVLEASARCAVGLAARLSLGGLAALFRRASVVAGVDSGPLHLAALMGTPVVALYGPADPAQFGLWSPPDVHRIVRIRLPCSPCGNLLDPPCGAVRDPVCVTGIAVPTVLAAIEAMLVARDRDPGNTVRRQPGTLL